jgi:hypothetical protein
MTPALPTEYSDEDRVPKLAGGNCRVKIFNAPMKAQAIPTPMSSLPRARNSVDSATEKRTAPSSAVK